MTKLGAFFWLGLVLASGFATFTAKYAVQDIDDQLTRVRRQTVAEQQEIRVLNAEWTYLNQPERLAEMNQRFLQLAPIAARQLQQKIEDVALRAPATTPDVVVAAAASTAPAISPQAAVGTPPLTIAALSQAAQQMPLPVRVAVAGPAGTPASLNALIAQIAGRP
jgi:hypothetical protein